MNHQSWWSSFIKAEISWWNNHHSHGGTPPPVTGTTTPPTTGTTTPPANPPPVGTTTPPTNPPPTGGTVFRVGPDETGTNAYSSPMALWSSGKLTDGATVRIDACTYTNDFKAGSGTGGVSITANNVTITAVPSTSVHCAAPDPWNGQNPNHPVMALIKQTSGSIAKGLWNIDGSTIAIDHIAFEGAVSSDNNGAGLRIENAGNVTLTDDYFAHNQDGILGGASSGTVSVKDSEFYDNGTDACSGACTHQIYINAGNLVVADSYFHDLDVSNTNASSGVGNQVKSRAKSTTLTNIRVFDNATHASYEVDLPQSGTIAVTGSVFEQGPNSENPVIMDTGENGNDGALNSSSGITVSGNTFVNDYQGNAVAVANGSPTTASITGNKWYGLTSSELTTGPVSLSGNTTLATRPTLDTSSPVK